MTEQRIESDYVAFLESENDQLREKIRQLQDLLGMRLEWPIYFDFTKQQGIVFGLLMRRDIVTRDAAMSALYGGADKVAEPKILDVFVLGLRRKIARYNLTIETVWGQGWYLKPETKAAVQALLDRPVESAA